MSARPQRIEVTTHGERRRRRWSAEEKQAIVAESVEPNVSIAAIARKHGIGTGQLYDWRHQFLTSHPGPLVHLQSAIQRGGAASWRARDGISGVAGNRAAAAFRRQSPRPRRPVTSRAFRGRHHRAVQP
jgi:transposase-like protein